MAGLAEVIAVCVVVLILLSGVVWFSRYMMGDRYAFLLWTGLASLALFGLSLNIGAGILYAFDS